MVDVKTNIWNEIYSETEGYLEAPDIAIVKLMNNSKISTSLDVGAENGRHTLFLAKNLDDGHGELHYHHTAGILANRT